MADGEDWTEAENAMTVASYLWMLRQELGGIPYVKAEEIRRLQQRGLERTSGAIEYKFQNISAVLDEIRWIFVDGYKPARHAQASLREEVVRQLLGNRELEDLMARRTANLTELAIALAPSVSDIELVDPPTSEKPDAELWFPADVGINRDYSLRDAKNRELGRKGEKFVVDFERSRLRGLGRPDLADKVAHVAVELGDGLGYDVRSFEHDEQERFIEVKTTLSNRDTPFFVSRNELKVSEHYGVQYYLYRLFSYGKESMGMYQLRGSLSETCRLTPDTYLSLPRAGE